MASGGWRMIDADPSFTAMWEAANPGVESPRCYHHPRGLTALMGREPIARDDTRWHISVRYGDPGENGRIPTWDELVATAHELRPGVAFSVGIPPRSWWLNHHPHVLHLYETRDPHLLAQFRHEHETAVALGVGGEPT